MIIMTDSYTKVVLYIFEVAFLATVNSCNYKERKEKNSEVNTLLTINKEDSGHLRDGFIIHCITTNRILFAFLFIFNLVISVRFKYKGLFLHEKAVP